MEFTYPTEKPIVRCLTVDDDRTIVGGHVTPGFRETYKETPPSSITVRNHARYSGRHVLDIGKESISRGTVVQIEIVRKIPTCKIISASSTSLMIPALVFAHTQVSSEEQSLHKEKANAAPISPKRMCF